jgi:hypothetical protein
MLGTETFWLYTRFFSLLLAVLITGVLTGITLEKWHAHASRPPLMVGDFSEEISLLHLDAIENGMLKGRLEGMEARIVVRDAEEVYSIFPGEFEFSVVEILPNLVSIPAPDGMEFVASRIGKYVYPLDDPQAAQITVKNRVFFPSLDAARTAGFVRRAD